MSWFSKLSQTFLGSPSIQGVELYLPQQIEDIQGIYQSKDFPHVFLGGREDFVEAEKAVSKPFCEIIDVSQSLPELSLWDWENYIKVEPVLIKLVNDLARIIAVSNCPIFVHCEAGANRSVAVLSGAISKLTGRSILDILREIKQQRGIASLHDVYLDMIIQNFELDASIKKMVRDRLVADSQKNIKIAVPKNWTFFLLGNRLEFDDELHEKVLTRALNVNSDLADIYRFLVPRGRVVYYGNKIIIEASAELAPYKKEIISELHFSAGDNPEFVFSDIHYQVWPKERATIRLLEYLERYPNTPRSKFEFVRKYRPDIYILLEPRLSARVSA